MASRTSAAAPGGDGAIHELEVSKWLHEVLQLQHCVTTVRDSHVTNGELAEVGHQGWVSHSPLFYTIHCSLGIFHNSPRDVSLTLNYTHMQ